MGFYDKLQEENTKTFTQNGAPTFSSSLNKNLDFFALAGASRNWNEIDIKEKFLKAFNEDPETALRNLVRLRDIRNGGLGERRAFRASVDYLIHSSGKEQILLGLIEYLPYIGRFDDIIYIFSETEDKEMKHKIARILSGQLLRDFEHKRKNESSSLLAKWMPSVNTSNSEVKQTAKELIYYMYGEWSPENEKMYRKTLSSLREHINVTEKRLTNKDYNKINYSQVPSLASIRYRNAFMRNDEERYREYLNGLDTGETKVNSSVTYPYQIVEAYRYSGMGEDKLLEEAWKSLPDYIGDNDERAVVVADTSGSMVGTPMNVSISLAIYCAQRLKGEFHGKYISFSTNPTINEVYDNASLKDNIDIVRRTDWGANTDFNKVLKLILDTAVSNNMSQDDIPNKIICLSDMEWDVANGGYGFGTRRAEELNETTYNRAKRKFEEHGYTIPQMVFWNVDAKGSTIPVRKDEVGTALVSGLTPAIFETVLSGEIMNPEKLMLDTLYQDKFDYVKDILKHEV